MVAVTENHFDDHFDDLVNKDVRGFLDAETSELLREPEYAERWYNSLLVLKKSVEAQLTTNKAEQGEKHNECMKKGPAGKREWFEYKAQADRWRSGAVRFKAGVEERLREARGNRNEERGAQYIDVVTRERTQAREYALELRSAIFDHKTHVCDDRCDDDICIADTELWSVLDEEVPF